MLFNKNKTIKLIAKTEWLPIKINQGILESTFTKAKKYNNNVLAIILSTKPCFYKLFSVWQEAKKRGLPYILMHSGQHYDDVVGFGIKEFTYDKALAIDLQIRGDLSQKSAELFAKLKEVALFLKKNWPHINIISYVNGDTISAGITPTAWAFTTNQKSIQGEAGLRGMSPKSFIKFNEKNNNDVDKFIKKQFNGQWIINRTEPFPEQLDTYISAAGCQYFFAPHKLNKEHLIREGYQKSDIFTVGNTVVDVMKLMKKERIRESIFDLYPKLKNGQWLRVDIHRRGNLTEKRFKAIIGSVINLVNNGKKVVFIELNATKMALEYYDLRKKIIELSQKNENFLFTPLWKKYVYVIEFLKSKHCWAVLTDSGSMQEEMNELRKPCLTARFNTDRPETVMIAHSNLLLPPVSKEFITKVVNYLYKNKQLKEKMSQGKRLYGENVAPKIISVMEKLFKNDASMFRWAQEELKIYKETRKDFRYL